MLFRGRRRRCCCCCCTIRILLMLPVCRVSLRHSVYIALAHQSVVAKRNDKADMSALLAICVTWMLHAVYIYSDFV